MSTIRLMTAVLAVPCTAVALASAVTAQSRFAQPPQQQQTVMRYAEMDANDDGVITRDEWRLTRQAFVAADLNGDGVLAGREIWIPVTSQTRAPGDFDLTLDGSAAATDAVGTAGAADSVAVRRSQFLNLDINRDGIVRLDEWTGNRGAFNRQDLNRDGVITRREYVGIEAGTAGAGADARTGAVGRRQSRRAPQVIRVNPQMRWTDTGIFVNAGDVLVLESIGTTQLSDNDTDLAAPAGSRTGRKASDAPLPQQLAGALIGRIGDSAPFGVGNLRLLQAPATGPFYLGVNDDHLPDNRGEFQVTVSIR